MIKKYLYDGAEYTSIQAVRQAVFNKERKAFGKPKNAEEWAKYGVTYLEEDYPIDELKQRKTFAVKQAFLRWRNSEATLVSSLGFVADSNERTKSDVESLLDLYESKQDEGVTFRDANNEFHTISYDDLKTLKCEIIDNGMFAYHQKWNFDALIDSATKKEELDKIDIKFVGKNYSLKE